MIGSAGSCSLTGHMSQFQSAARTYNYSLRPSTMNNLRSLGNHFSIQIRPDEDSYLGRECPVEQCLGYFKITPGTGVKGPAPCHCPYCGHCGKSETFFTQEQIAYAQSVVMRKVTDAIQKDLK